MQVATCSTQTVNENTNAPAEVLQSSYQEKPSSLTVYEG